MSRFAFPLPDNPLHLVLGRRMLLAAVGILAVAAIGLSFSMTRSDPSGQSTPTRVPTPIFVSVPVTVVPIKEVPTAPPTVQSTATPSSKERIHTVVAGDTLRGLALKYYGDANKWTKIVDANKDALPDPNQLKVGQKLKIPE